MQSSRALEVRLSKFSAAFAATVTSFVVLGAGCSKDTAKPSTSTYSAIPTSPVEGWTDASVPENMTATQACTKYARAVCERKNECGLGNDDCAKAVANCPDSLFSDGSTRDAASTWQCAFVMRQRSCLDVYLSANPSCVTPGTKKTGETCIAAAQCASLACTGSTTSCGSCLQRVTKGQACSISNGTTCDRGLTCETATGTCVDLPTKSFDDTVSTGLEIGKDCDLTRNLCATGAYCELTDGGTGVCTARIAEGQDCVNSGSCIEGTYCFQEGNRCYKIPSAGGRCGNDVETGNALWCTDDAFCNNTSHMCELLPVAGQPCATTQLSGGPILCAASAICDSAATPPTCKALAGPTETCTDDSECQKGLRCFCPDTSCASRVCGVLRDVTESCANPGELCNAVSTCIDGECKANSSQGLYAKACGG